MNLFGGPQYEPYCSVHEYVLRHSPAWIPIQITPRTTNDFNVVGRLCVAQEYSSSHEVLSKPFYLVLLLRE